MKLLGTSERNMHYIVPCVRINTCKKKRAFSLVIITKGTYYVTSYGKVYVGFGGMRDKFDTI